MTPISLSAGLPSVNPRLSGFGRGAMRFLLVGLTPPSRTPPWTDSQRPPAPGNFRLRRFCRRLGFADCRLTVLGLHLRRRTAVGADHGLHLLEAEGDAFLHQLEV